MKPVKNQWDVLGISYAITLAINLVLVLLLARLIGLTNPIWALISVVVCTELDTGQVRQIVLMRLVATFVGAGIALFVLLVSGPGATTILVGSVLITLVCHYLMRVKNWKLAVITGLIVLVVGLQNQSIDFAEQVAVQRALEVIAGSITTAIVSPLLGKFFAAIPLWRQH